MSPVVTLKSPVVTLKSPVVTCHLVTCQELFINQFEHIAGKVEQVEVDNSYVNTERLNEENDSGPKYS